MSGGKRGPWLINGEREIFDNPWLKLVDYPVTRPDGAPGQYSVVQFKNRAVGVLPVDDEGYTYLVGQHRFPRDYYSWELPEGGCPMGEDPLDGAKRELQEETGLSAGRFIPLFNDVDLSNSVTDETSTAYLALDLVAGDASPEGTEELEIKRVLFSSLLEDVISDKIQDSFTVMMVMNAHIKAVRGLLPAEICRFLS